MMLENCCYDFFELLTISMAQKGFFGEIVHAEGAYLHDLSELLFRKTGYANLWRLKENSERNGCLYPTHGLGPVCQAMNINRGDQMEFLTSVSSADFRLGATANKLAEEDPVSREYKGRRFRGNMNTRSYPHIPEDDTANIAVRGGRLFLITEANAEKYRTWMRFSDGSVNWESLSESYTNSVLK